MVFLKFCTIFFCWYLAQFQCVYFHIVCKIQSVFIAESVSVVVFVVFGYHHKVINDYADSPLNFRIFLTFAQLRDSTPTEYYSTPI